MRRAQQVALCCCVAFWLWPGPQAGPQGQGSWGVVVLVYVMYFRPGPGGCAPLVVHVLGVCFFDGLGYVVYLRPGSGRSCTYVFWV